jgi:hypothetical protein
MTRAELLDLLAVERHAPGPRAPCYVRGCDPPEPITAEQAAENLRVLRDAIGGDLYAVAHNDRKGA